MKRSISDIFLNEGLQTSKVSIELAEFDNISKAVSKLKKVADKYTKQEEQLNSGGADDLPEFELQISKPMFKTKYKGNNELLITLVRLVDITNHKLVYEERVITKIKVI